MAAERSFTKLKAQRVDLEVAAEDRLKDAEALLDCGRYAASIAMGVYALEIRLKVAICSRLNLNALPQAFEIHDLEGLLILTGLRGKLDSAAPGVLENWTYISVQSAKINELRYSPALNWTKNQAEEMLQRLRDLPHGVLPWLLAAL